MAATFVFASSNPHKLEEIRHILPAQWDLKGLRDIGFAGDVEETGRTFEDNARLKADAIFDFSGLMCFADDSGLEVEALDGRPGVKSARYAGEPPDHGKNTELLLSELAGRKNRKARFKTVICLRMDGRTFFFEGTVEGHIAEIPRGDKGFGYDPVFVPAGDARTFAEMSLEEKNSMSHRKIAIGKMLDFLRYV